MTRHLTPIGQAAEIAAVAIAFDKNKKLEEALEKYDAALTALEKAFQLERDPLLRESIASCVSNYFNRMEEIRKEILIVSAEPFSMTPPEGKKGKKKSPPRRPRGTLCYSMHILTPCRQLTIDLKMNFLLHHLHLNPGMRSLNVL